MEVGSSHIYKGLNLFHFSFGKEVEERQGVRLRTRCPVVLAEYISGLKFLESMY